MKLISWNVNGVRAAARKGLLDWLGRECPNVLCMQETKSRPEQLPPELADPAGYDAVLHAARRPGYSGVATWIRRPGPEAAEPGRVVESKPGIGIECYDCEGRVLATDFGAFTLLNCYFPNGQRDLSRLDFKMAFCQAFLEYCNDLRRAGKRLVVCGDINTAHKEVDLARPKENAANSGFLPVERAWVDQFVASGFVDTFRLFQDGPGHYSWWSYLFNARRANIGWRIDYFFVTEDLVPAVRSASILPEVMGSDHCPVTLEIEP